jgi:hypothetical protein
MPLYPFALERLCVSLKSTSAARTSCDGVSIVLEPGAVDQSSLCNIDHFPNLMLGLLSQASNLLMLLLRAQQYVRNQEIATVFRNVKTDRGRSPHLDVQSEKASDYNYYDHYADDVEDVHLVCSSWNPVQLKRTGALNDSAICHETHCVRRPARMTLNSCIARRCMITCPAKYLSVRQRRSALCP